MNAPAGLEILLQLREAAYQDAQRRMSAAVAEEARLDAAFGEIEGQLRSMERRRSEAVSPGELDVRQIQASLSWQAELQLQLQRTEIALRAAARECQRLREKLARAKRQRDTLARRRDEARREHVRTRWRRRNARVTECLTQNTHRCKGVLDVAEGR